MTSGNEQTLADAVTAALATVKVTPADGGAVRLAGVYAAAIDDDPAQVGKLGPGLLAVLEALGMSPRARAAIAGKGVKDAPARNRLDELRERRRARVAGSAAVDSSAT